MAHDAVSCLDAGVQMGEAGRATRPHLRVVFVCAANQCRSRAAAVLFERALGERAAHLSLSSAGVQVDEPLTMCSTAIAHVQTLGIAAHPAFTSTADALTAEDIRDTDLVFALDRDVRKRILEIDASSRSKVFTLRQAGAASAHLLDSGLLDAAVQAGARHEPTVMSNDDEEPHVLVTALSADPTAWAGWLAAEFEAMQAAITRGREPYLDVPDAHGVRFPRRQHAKSLALIDDAVAQLARLMRALPTA